MQDAYGNYVVGVLPEPYTPGNSIAGGGAGVPQVIAAADADPNVAVVVPDNPLMGALYYQEPISLLNLWLWSVDDQQWYQYSG